MPKTALLTNVLAHYRVPCFQELSSLLDNQITFFIFTKEMSHRKYVFATSQSDLEAHWLAGVRWHIPPYDDRHLNDIRPVIRGKYDIIIMGGWDEPTYLLTWLWGVLTKKKVIFWIESTAYETNRRGIKEFYKRILLKYAAGCIVPGSRSREYCETLGMPDKRIFTAPNATDRAFFSDHAARFMSQREELKKQLHLKGVTVLFVGRLVEKHKRVSMLIKAFGRLEQQGLDADLLIVGDGPDRALYEKIVRGKNLTRVTFVGEVDHTRLCEMYAASDMQVLPSVWEPWGFVLNEGMEFGLPLIVSEAVGAAPDLVRQGENGFIFPVDDVDALTEKIASLVQDEALRKKMGELSRHIIEGFSPENWAKGVKHAIGSVTGKAC